jgi:phenylalanine ammonia-lyase
MLTRFLGTDNFTSLQLALMQHTQSVVTTNLDTGEASLLQGLGSHSMQYSWVKASMLVQEHQALRSQGVVRVEVIETLNEMICKNLIPLVPLRDPISASGDLMPLASIAGALQGCPDISVSINQGGGYNLLSADHALKLANIKPIVPNPKEGLGLISGTAPSTALGTLALYEANQLAVLSQYLSILASEALGDNLEWLNPFIANSRSPVNQKEFSTNMRTFVVGSKLVSCIHSEKDRFKVGLCQDRHSTHSSHQWIGPQLEDLMIAHQQVTTELNSTSDNSILDVNGSDILSGTNFQAASVASAMDKTRLSLEALAKMLFVQCRKMINPDLNNGLPAKLAADYANLSYTMRGVDANMAGYMFELTHITNSVNSHVQSAYQHSHAVNSLAFTSARYTMAAADLVSLMSACFIYVGCQGLDLRVMHNTFLESLQPIIQAITCNVIGNFLPRANIEALHVELSKNITKLWTESTSLDAHDRCEKVVSLCIPILSSGLVHNEGTIPSSLYSVAAVETWRRKVLAAVNAHYFSFRGEFYEKQTTVGYLGQASKKIYSFVREELGVPFHKGFEEHSTPGNCLLGGRQKRTIGSWIGVIYESLRDGRLYDRLMEALGEGLDGEGGSEAVDGLRRCEVDEKELSTGGDSGYASPAAIGA